MKPAITLLPVLLASLLCTSAIAQTSPPHAAQRGAELQKRWQDADLDKDGQLTKAEAQVGGLRMVVDHFDAIDTNKDGKVSQEEMRAWGQNHRGGARPKPGSDGKAGDDKMRRPPPPAGAANGAPPPPGGFKSPDERRAAIEERFKKADTNGDGALSKTEVQASGNQRLLDNFDAIDANKDGKITPEELRNFWQQRMGGPRK